MDIALKFAIRKEDDISQTGTLVNIINFSSKYCPGLQIFIYLHRFHAVALLSARHGGSSVGDRVGLHGRDALDGDVAAHDIKSVIGAWFLTI